MTDVVLLHSDDCPNVGAAREALRTALEKSGARSEWREVLLGDRSTPRAWAALGSPTVLVNGEDVSVESAPGASGGNCRLYADAEGKLSGVPPVDDIVAALHRAVSSTGGGRARFVVGGAIATAVGASACCLGPLALTVAGVGGASAFSALAEYRPILFGITLSFLGAALYWSRHESCTAGSCASDDSAHRRTRVWLWGAAAVAVALLASPWVIARASAAAEPAAAPLANETTAIFGIRGIDCEACATPIRSALAEVGGLRALSLDLKESTVTIRYESAPGRLSAYERAIAELGYEVHASKSPEASR